jgi:hypothetical protein
MVLDFSIYFDDMTTKLYYMAASNAYPKVGAESEYNTGIIVQEVTLGSSSVTFKPVSTLPGRFEGMAMFRWQNDLYMLASAQDGFGPNPTALFLFDPSHPGTTAAGFQPNIPIGAFTCLGYPFSGSMRAFHSQPTQVLKNPFKNDGKNFVLLADNWLHGPERKDGYPAPGESYGPQGVEPSQGWCPKGWPNDSCPASSRPGSAGGYVWLPFNVSELNAKSTPPATVTNLIRAYPLWNIKCPPEPSSSIGTYTFETQPKLGYIESSCGFASCGFEKNCDCAKLGDVFTNARSAGLCDAKAFNEHCSGSCPEDANGNIPNGTGGCVFDPSVGLVSTTTDLRCTKARADVYDPCTGHQSGFPQPLI